VIRHVVALLASAPFPAAVSAGADTPPPFSFTREVRAGERTFLADFGRIAVPERRGRDGSPGIEIAVCRLRSTAEKPGPPLFFLPGLPGTATSLRESEAFAPLFARILERCDVVLLDQRGTGESRPNLDWDSPDWKPWLLYGGEAAATAHALDSARAARAHFAKPGFDTGAYDALESADDVDAVRRAIGYGRADLMGHSSGSHLALTVLRRHPDAVRRLVSVGTAGPDDLMKPPSESDAALARVARLVREDPAAGKGMPDLAGSLRALLEKLEKEPQPVRVADPRTGESVETALGAFGLRLLLLQDLGDETDLTVFPRLVRSLENRDPALAEWFLGKRVRQLRRFPVALFASRASIGASKGVLKRIESEAPGSLFGTARLLFCPAIGAALGVRDVGDEARSAVKSDVPALFVSGTLDAHTPPDQAERVRAGFPNSVHLVLEDLGHDSILFDERARERIVAFLAGKPAQDERLAGTRLRFAPVEGAADPSIHPSLSTGFVPRNAK